MTTILIVGAILIGAYMIVQAIRQNSHNQIINSAEYKKEIQLIEDSLRQRTIQNYFDRPERDENPFFKIYDDMYKDEAKKLQKKHSDGIKINLAFEDWPPYLVNESNKLDREEEKVGEAELEKKK